MHPPPTLAHLFHAVEAAFNRLPPSGKPTPGGWTVLAGVVAQGGPLPSPVVVSLATGTKCIGARDLVQHGCVLHDCHAEVLAVRGLRCLLLAEVAEHAGCTTTGEACTLPPGRRLLQHCGGGAVLPDGRRHAALGRV